MHTLSFPLRRAFLALPLKGEAKTAFREIQERLYPHEKIFRFQNVNSSHLTLIFWRELMELEYEGILQQVEKISQQTEPFTLSVLGVDTFEKRGLARILLLTVAFSPELAVLKKRCPWTSGESFFPHITLARVSHPNAFRVHSKKIMRLLKGESFKVPVDRIRLYAEVDGVRQTPVKDFVFG